MVTLTFYTRRGCHLCENALDRLNALRQVHGFALEIRDVDAEAEWRELYGMLVPVTVLPDGEELHYRVVPERITDALKKCSH